MDKANSHSILPPKSDKSQKGHTRNINFFPYNFKSVDANTQKMIFSQGSNNSYPQKSINSSFEASPCPEEIIPTKYMNTEQTETNAIFSSSFPKESQDRRAKSTIFTPIDNSLTTKFSAKECNSAFQTSRFYPASRQNYSQEYNDNNYIPGLVTETEFLKQYKETNERISRLESLIWKIFNNSLPQMYEELDAKIQNSVKNNIELIEEHKDTVLNVFNSLNDEIQNFKSIIIEKHDFNTKEDKITPKEIMHSGELPEVIEEESNISESEGLGCPDFSISNPSRKDSSSSHHISPSPIHREYELEKEMKESDVEENPEFYFSCHEKMITNIQNSEMSRRSSISEVFDPRETNTMPNLSQSTLMDQIDYELDGLKVNEYSSEMKEVEEDQIGNVKHYSNTPWTSDKKQHQSVVIRDIVFKSLSHLNSGAYK